MIRSLALIAGLVLSAGIAAAEAPDWTAAADVEEVQVLTTDVDGEPRETIIWLAVVDGRGYIRTSRSTTWGGNVERDPELVLRVEGREHPLRAVFVEEEATRARVIGTFREKYGFSDAFIGIIRGSHPRIMRLEPRT